MPAASEILPLGSNIEAISRLVSYPIDQECSREAPWHDLVVVVGGEKYGEGSSRGYAAPTPRYLGVRAYIVLVAVLYEACKYFRIVILQIRRERLCKDS